MCHIWSGRSLSERWSFLIESFSLSLPVWSPLKVKGVVDLLTCRRLQAQWSPSAFVLCLWVMWPRGPQTAVSLEFRFLTILLTVLERLHEDSDLMDVKRSDDVVGHHVFFCTLTKVQFSLWSRGRAGNLWSKGHRVDSYPGEGNATKSRWNCRHPAP